MLDHTKNNKDCILDKIEIAFCEQFLIIVPLSDIITNSMKHLYILIFSIIYLTACQNAGNPLVTDYKPKAISKSNDIVVVADKDIWEGEVGDTFRYYFESAYPITPSPEPIFNLRYFSPRELKAEPLRKELRSYCVLADLRDTLSETTKMIKSDYGNDRFNKILMNDSIVTGVGRDKWAKDQLVVYIFANGEEKLNDAIRNNFNNVTNKIHAHDATQIKANTYVTGRNLGLIEKLKNEFLVSVDIPGDYKEALFIPEGDKMIWLRKDTKRATLNLVFRKYSYTDISQISVSNALNLTNEFGMYVNTDTEGSHLVVNDVDLPILENVKEINGNYTLEVRGIWEMENDFMGGPFVSYLIPDSNSNSYFFITSFVYAPGREKKLFLQEMEVVVNSFDFLTK